MAMRGKIRWGDTLDEDDVLPPTTVKGPDDHGIKVVTEYFKTEKGDVMKKVSKLKVVHVEKKVYKVSAPGGWCLLALPSNSLLTPDAGSSSGGRPCARRPARPHACTDGSPFSPAAWTASSRNRSRVSPAALILAVVNSQTSRSACADLH